MREPRRAHGGDGELRAPQDRVREVRGVEVRACEVDLQQQRVGEVRAEQVGAGPDEVAVDEHEPRRELARLADEAARGHADLAWRVELGVVEPGVRDRRAGQRRADEVGAREARVLEVRAGEVRVVQVRPREVGVREIDAAEPLPERSTPGPNRTPPFMK